MDRVPGPVLRGFRPAGRRRPRERVAQGPDRHPGGAGRPHRGLPGHRRQRHRDDRARARERAHRGHAVRVRRAAADPAPARPRPGGLPRRRRVRRAAVGVRLHPARGARVAPLDRGRRRDPRGRLLRLRRAADGLPRRARAPGQVVGQGAAHQGAEEPTRVRGRARTPAASTACPAWADAPPGRAPAAGDGGQLREHADALLELGTLGAAPGPGAAEAIGELAERLENTYPYPDPMYAGQMLKPPAPWRGPRTPRRCC